MKTGWGCGADKTVRTGGHGKPSEKLPGRKGRTAVYRGGTQAGSAGARSDGFCQNKRSCGGFKPSGADKMADKFYYAVTDGVPEQKKVHWRITCSGMENKHFKSGI